MSVADSFELTSRPGEEIYKGNRNFKCNNLESFIGSGAYNKVCFFLSMYCFWVNVFMKI